MRAGKNLRYYERVLDKSGQRELINPRLCGHICCCSGCVKVKRRSDSSVAINVMMIWRIDFPFVLDLPQVDAIEYYCGKEKFLLEEVRQEAEIVPQHPLGIAFVTLQNEAMAK